MREPARLLLALEQRQRHVEEKVRADAAVHRLVDAVLPEQHLEREQQRPQLRVPREREVHFEVDGPHQDAPQKPRRRRYGLLFLSMAVVAYFWPLQSAPPVKRMRLRLKSPKIPQKLQILTARPTHFKWRRDGAIELEANVIMRMWNDHPVPLKIRALNTTILLRSLFSEERYAVGYKTATKIKVPPKGHADVPAQLVIYGLRVFMFPSL